MVLFGLLTLVTGPLWARRAWGTFWVWDARTTSSLVSWMIAWAYLILRRYGGPGSEKLAAALALFGMANVPFIYISVNYWRTIHPATTVVPTLPFSMGLPLWFCVVTFTLLFVLLLKLRIRVEEQQARVDALYLSLDEHADEDAETLVCRGAGCRSCGGIAAAAQQPSQQEEFLPRQRVAAAGTDGGGAAAHRRLCVRAWRCSFSTCWSVARRLTTVQQELNRLDSAIKQGNKG